MGLIFLGILLAYILLLFAYEKAFERNFIPSSDYKSEIACSVVIPFRNESKNLPALIQSLKMQEFPDSKLEFIFVNDHSEDKFYEHFESLDERFRLIELDGEEGKKAAIKLGVEKANNEHIICTDADCEMGRNWVKSFAECFEKKSVKFIAAAVLGKTNERLLNKMIQLELGALIGITAGAFGRKKPIVCNGANMAFLRKDFLVLNPYESKEQSASGDDVFLLFALKKKYGNQLAATFINSPDAIVRTKLPESMASVFQQKIRWASKIKQYKDEEALIQGGVLSAMNGLIVAALVLGYSTNWFPILLVVKSVADFSLLRKVKVKFDLQVSFSAFVYLSIVYPFYTTIVGILSLFLTAKWKGRQL